MARVYAVEEVTGRRFLAKIVCDACDEFILPNADIANSGWVKCGILRGPSGDYDEWDYCPGHAGLVSEVEQRAQAEALHAKFR